LFGVLLAESLFGIFRVKGVFGAHRKTQVGPSSGRLTSTQFYALLSSNFTLLALNSTSSVYTCLEFLIEKNIYGAPLKNEKTNEWLTFVELTDLLKIIINEKQKNPKLNLENLKQLSILNYVEELGKSNLLWSLSENSPLQTVIDALMSRSRVVLIKDDSSNSNVKEITGLISRSTVIQYLAANLKNFSAAENEILQKTIEQSGVMTKEVITLTDSPQNHAIDAFNKIVHSGVSHLAILSEDTKAFIGNVSVKDIKLILARDVGCLDELTLHEYVNIIRQQNLKAIHPAIHGGLHDTVEKTLTRLAVIKIHKLYITNDSADNEATVNRAIVGVISLRDLLSLFANTKPQ